MKLDAILTCPACGGESGHSMPVDACVQALACPRCEAIIRRKEGTCCVFCSHADTLCPDKQAEAM